MTKINWISVKDKLPEKIKCDNCGYTTHESINVLVYKKKTKNCFEHLDTGRYVWQIYKGVKEEFWSVGTFSSRDGITHWAYFNIPLDYV